MKNKYRTFLIAGLVFVLILPSTMVRAGADSFEFERNRYGYHTQLPNNSSTIDLIQGENGLSSTYSHQNMALELEPGFSTSSFNFAKPDTSAFKHVGSKSRLRAGIGEIDRDGATKDEWWQPHSDDARVELEEMSSYRLPEPVKAW